MSYPIEARSHFAHNGFISLHVETKCKQILKHLMVQFISNTIHNLMIFPPKRQLGCAYPLWTLNPIALRLMKSLDDMACRT